MECGSTIMGRCGMVPASGLAIPTVAPKPHQHPHTGEEFFVFSCFNQDPHQDFVDFKNLNERLRANSIQEKLTNLWLDRAFKSIDNGVGHVG